jgi:hypothetical protein
VGILFCLTAKQIRENAWPAVVDALATEPESGSLGIISFGDNLSGSMLPSPDTRLYADSLSLGTSLVTPKTIPALALYDQFRQSSDYAEFRFIALKLLNRVDLSGTFRLLDREVILQSVLADIFEILRTRRPGLVVFEVTPHEFRPYLLMAAANFLGIKVLFFQPCPITPAMIPLTGLRNVLRLKKSTVAGSSIAESLLDTARAQLGKLVDQTDPRYIELQRARDAKVRRPARRIFALWHTVRWLFTDRFPESVSFSGHKGGGLVGRKLGSVMLTRSLQRALSARVNRLGHAWSGPPDNFVVLALHYEPERTSLPEGLPIVFQGDALASLRANMSPEVAVVVKEHYSQQSAALRGFAGRSPDFYDLVEHLPNTSFAPTSERLSDLVGAARAVFTLTGTVAIESVLKGTPVGYWGSPWWAGMPGTLRIQSSEDFNALENVAMPAVDEVFVFFDRLVGDVMIPGIASERPEVAERKLGPLPDGFFDQEALGLLEAIRKVLLT